ncbi:hypothetical protein PUN28_007537 [Cardiocondyla obscurior]|uniref:Uncharacterized protein n=1 Tax=Cardiocondyla obscurior TaxID=286306 RepID=A0AAW2G631_9HYME
MIHKLESNSRINKITNNDEKVRNADDDVISKKSLDIVKILEHFFLKHAKVEGLFRRAGRCEIRQYILNSLKKGHKSNFKDSNNAAVECSAALQIYLNHLKNLIMPQHTYCGKLSYCVRCFRSFIKQDVSGCHVELLTYVLDLLRHLTLSRPPSEYSKLRGSPLPKQVAAKFNELITEAAVQCHRDEQYIIYYFMKQFRPNFFRHFCNLIVQSHTKYNITRCIDLRKLRFPPLQLPRRYPTVRDCVWQSYIAGQCDTVQRN